MRTKITDSIPLRPLIDLARKLPKSDLETLAVEAIIEYRKRAVRTEELSEALHQVTASCKISDEIQREFVASMMYMHTQMAVVAALTDVLGYIPRS